MKDRIHSVPGLRVGRVGWFSGGRTGGLELDSLARIVRRCVEGQQQGAVALVGMACGSGILRNRGGADQDDGEKAESDEGQPRSVWNGKPVHKLERLCKWSALASSLRLSSRTCLVW